ncbi:MAG TPA: hypothetical protein VGO21_05165, partial [Candidatus Paceibacterota bacterium]|nr:hypothetical protein [Candidatus Paceibacterota bacterium]
MQNFFIHFIPVYFKIWHLPIVFMTGLIAEGYGIVIGSGSVLTQFVLLSLGMPLPVVIATDIGGCLGSGIGAVTALPR